MFATRCRTAAIVCTGVLILATGCAKDEPVPIHVVADTFCTTAKKRMWSVDDTTQSIDDAIRFNRGWDCACGTGKIKKEACEVGKSSPATS